jgi:predicted AAA+ superfamily ATPase
MVFDTCHLRPEVLAGDLPDAIFAADLWEVMQEQAHPDYKDPRLFFSNSHPTESLKLLLSDVGARLDGNGSLISRSSTPPAAPCD